MPDPDPGVPDVARRAGDGDRYQEREFVLLGDEGVKLGGTDAAPGAVEELMYALGTCIVAAANANAALMGVELTRLEVDLASDLNLHGLFALDPDVRPGVLEMRARITIDGNADDETLRKIARLGYRYSPVSESLRNGISVVPEIITGGTDTAAGHADPSATLRTPPSAASSPSQTKPPSRK